MHRQAEGRRKLALPPWYPAPAGGPARGSAAGCPRCARLESGPEHGVGGQDVHPRREARASSARAAPRTEQVSRTRPFGGEPRAMWASTAASRRCPRTGHTTGKASSSSPTQSLLPEPAEGFARKPSPRLGGEQPGEEDAEPAQAVIPTRMPGLPAFTAGRLPFIAATARAPGSATDTQEIWFPRWSLSGMRCAYAGHGSEEPRCHAGSDLHAGALHGQLDRPGDSGAISRRAGSALSRSARARGEATHPTAHRRRLHRVHVDVLPWAMLWWLIGGTGQP